MEEPQKYATVNISGSINILNQMVESGTPSIIFSSTAAVYGDPEYIPIDESHPLNPVNFYGHTKLAIENLIGWYSKLKGVNFAALRYFNAVGYDGKGRIRGVEKNPANLFPLVMEVAGGKRDYIEVFGNDYDTPDGTGVRDYIHVSDLASAHYNALKYIESIKGNLTVNLSTGMGYSVLDIINKAKEITGRDIPFKIENRRDGDSATVVAGSQIAHQKLEWECTHSDIEISLETMWKVYSLLMIC
jgi:UDP-glucose 4-epimerase